MHAYESVTMPWQVFVLVEWGVYIEHFHHMNTTPFTKAVNVSVFGLWHHNNSVLPFFELSVIVMDSI